ncbi:hypothetical protein HanHA300_Chr03g0087551 [Helianthus annuus]|nr:hypothetical protein HanHA300_Chr03g0087551 [Helianthus annuus]KAJ0607645.1 hypothetical protein HanHA89_Chr03g0099151 [Helianthus annuus]KAJ0767709.1 hypothetical protein HanLR1_Chr03g0092511 [Helianthus annuus]
MPQFRLVGASILRDLFYCYMLSRMSCLYYDMFDMIICIWLCQYCYLFSISFGIQVMLVFVSVLAFRFVMSAPFDVSLRMPAVMFISDSVLY